MATKKTETAKAETKAETKVVDDGMEEIFIPIDYANPDDTTYYCGVNGTAMFIPKGETVRVPRKYAREWKNKEKEIKAKLERQRAAKAAEYEANKQYINTTT